MEIVNKMKTKLCTGQKTVLAILLFGMISSISSAASAPTPTDEIHVSADTLISARKASYAEFAGNVVTTQKGAVMYSDRLKIMYSSKSDKPVPDKKGKGSIEKIYASGNVKIVFEDKTSWSDDATYTTSDDTILLTGKRPRVVMGKNWITGSTIKINRTTEEVFVNGEPKTAQSKSSSGRVEFSVYPDETGGNSSSGNKKK